MQKQVQLVRIFRTLLDYSLKDLLRMDKDHKHQTNGKLALLSQTNQPN